MSPTAAGRRAARPLRAAVHAQRLAELDRIAGDLLDGVLGSIALGEILLPDWETQLDGLEKQAMDLLVESSLSPDDSGDVSNRVREVGEIRLAYAAARRILVLNRIVDGEANRMSETVVAALTRAREDSSRVWRLAAKPGRTSSSHDLIRAYQLAEIACIDALGASTTRAFAGPMPRRVTRALIWNLSHLTQQMARIGVRRAMSANKNGGR